MAFANMTPADLRDMINGAVAAAVQNQQPQPGPPGPPGPQGDPGQPGADGQSGGGADRWNAADLGFFDPHLDKSYGGGDIVTVGKDLYYRSVILFVERIKDIVSTKGAALVRSNLNTTLRGAALRWYTAELSNLERLGLRAEGGNGVDEWCEALVKRFRENTNVALGNLNTEKYTLQDARVRREPADYVQAIIRHIKSAEIDGVKNQLLFTYYRITSELRVFVTPPKDDTTVSSFIQALEEKKDAWFEMHYTTSRPSQTQQQRGFQ